MKEMKTFHPLIIALYFIGCIGFSMFSMNPIYLSISLLMAIIINVKLTSIISFKRIIFLVILFVLVCMIINAMFVHQGFTILFFMNDNPITLESIIFGLSFALMISATLIWFKNLSLIMDSDKVVYLLGRISPLLAFIISLVLRYIPYLQDYYHKIKDFHKINYDIKNRNLFDKLKSSIHCFLALVSFAFENSLDSVNSINSLGYGSRKRTNYHLYHFEKRDLFALVLLFICMGLTIFIYFYHNLSFYYYPKIAIVSLDSLSIISYMMFLLFLILPLIFEIEEEIRWRLSISKI
ncbi:MAG: energy-coupling factor transporter transmembrane protein EcfT [Bacilli bacterium]|jgi:energy-coupling factor transport system permease protein|nr:energy-coupling factor transporter transmembrane protein EcfT [Bacilli bacterium]